MSDSGETPAREITPPEVYFNRRTFMRVGIVAGTTVVTGRVLAIERVAPRGAKRCDIRGYAGGGR